MPYATKTDIESDFKDIVFGSTGNVTADDVTQFIVEADSLINAYVGMRYLTPVTTGDGLQLLKLFSRSLVANRIRGIMYVKSAKTEGAASQEPKRELLSYRDVLAELVKIRDSSLDLQGATLKSEADGFYSSNAVNDVKPVMRKDTRQW